MGCKKRLFDHGPSAERVQGMTCNTNKKEIAKLNETIDKLEAAKDELQENLQVKDDDFDNLYRQYTNLTYNSAIRDQHHKRCTHLRLSSQVSAYTPRQVSEAIFSQTFYEKDPDIDNVFVPYITVELQGHLKKGKQTNIFMAKHGRNRYCCKEYSDEGKYMMAHHEFQVLSCLNAKYTPYPIGISLSNRKPGLVTSLHQVDDLCYNLGDFLSTDAYRPLSGEEWANVAVTLGIHLRQCVQKSFFME
ncbi:uncharacterized protein LOC135492654 [Lineus longissimus]|uniref:uncharacterized protein LOC135492654 n=1 Tax=Lineus longissimus TaxID=88925 RepID=UPI00315CB025